MSDFGENIAYIIDKFSDASPVASIAHLVLEDGNLWDSSIHICLDAIEDNGEEYIKDHAERLKGIDAKAQLHLVEAFLNLLLRIPEDQRVEESDEYNNYYEDEEE